MISLSNIGSLTVTAVVTGEDDGGWWKLCLVVVVVVVGGLLVMGVAVALQRLLVTDLPRTNPPEPPFLKILK